jgi:hypothetical protein
MKISLALAGCFAGFALGTLAHSQAPAAAQTPIQRLQAMKVLNKQLLDRQAETLKLLDALQLEAQQLKFLGKRS